MLLYRMLSAAGSDHTLFYVIIKRAMSTFLLKQKAINLSCWNVAGETKEIAYFTILK